MCFRGDIRKEKNIFNFAKVLCYVFFLFCFNVQAGEPISPEIECTFGDGNSFNKGANKIGLYYFFNGDVENERLLFLNFNGWFCDDGSKGLSSGIGLRRKCEYWIYGVNIYHELQVDPSLLSQIGVGFEISSTNYYLYGNVYIPVGNKLFGEKDYIFDDYIGDFWVRCNQKMIIANAFEVVLSKSLLKRKVLKTSISAGLYGLDFVSCCEKCIGFKGNLRFEFFDSVYLEPQVYYDKLSRIKIGAKIGISYPLNRFMSICRPIVRKEGISYKKCCKYQKNY